MQGSVIERNLARAQRWSYLTPESAQTMLDLTAESGRLLNGLLRSLTTDH